ncbi:hypothetical protein X474_23390 [Dethiosulfatarculus sandiegensis]|uniref:Uncharacterized protein n=1 Tax=Dethiosulfatarculus sandiegensis TaxID=1429043 RepID=A0A0D2G9T5_9BACT|nr:hypothetical protein X474_23390 [Dethiosulfatarculus sandiegensis]
MTQLINMVFQNNMLVDTGDRLKTADGTEVEVWEFCHEQDETVHSAWAKHFLQGNLRGIFSGKPGKSLPS